MISEKYYIDYFNQISSIQRIMIYQLNDLIQKVENEKILNALKGLVSDKIAHYAYVLTILETMLAKDPQQNKRDYGRDHFLGKVRIRPQNSEEDIFGYCVNVSPSGVCIEFDYEFDPKDSLEIWISFYYNRKEEHHVGEIAWQQKIHPEQLVRHVTTIAGIKFLKK